MKKENINEGQVDLLDEYILYLKIQENDPKNAKTVLKIFFNYINNTGGNHLRIKSTEAQEFQQYLSTLADETGNLRYVSSTVSTMIVTMTAFYEYLKMRKKIFHNPFVDIQRIKQKKMLPRNILNEEEMNKLLASLKNFMKGKSLIERRNLYKSHVLAELMYSTGARIGELARLKPGDIDFIKGTVSIHDSKANQHRECILNGFAKEVLWIYVKEMRELVFTGTADREYLFGSLKNIKAIFNKILSKESERLKFGKFKSHGIRHTVGVHLLKAGCDIRFIQEILGHKTLKSTQIYTRVSKEDLKSVLDSYHPRVFKRSEKSEKL